MSEPHSSAEQRYFLGIAGKQIGPLSEAEVILRIKTGSISMETLIWYEGLKEWALINTIPVFDSEFKSRSSPEKKERIEPKKVAEPPEKKKRATSVGAGDSLKFLGDDKSISIVFDAKEARLGDSFFVFDRVAKILFGLGALSLVVMGYFYIAANQNRNQVESVRQKRGVASSSGRQVTLSKATSELLIEPKKSEEALLALIRSNSLDAIAQEASKTLLEYYQRNKRWGDAGRMLMSINQYAEAARYFTMDPSGKNEAENAYFLAYEKSKDPVQKKELLEENIKTLLKLNSPVEKVLERIRLLEKDFPNQAHPFRYYLKPIDDRIADIFSRISFYFVQGILSYVDVEFPEISLIERPLVKIKKDKSGQYKLIGTYFGEILLNKDRLQNIKFVFWLEGNRWALVDTNLTRERKNWAAQERKKLKNTGISGEQMLKTLEGMFQNKFPNASLHERDLSSAKETPSKTPDF